MIKFALRRNFIYPLQLLLWNVARDIECIIISHSFNIKTLKIYTPLMFLGEIFGGLSFYLYQSHFLSKNKRKRKGSVYFMNIKYIKARHNPIKDGPTKIYFLIFCAAFFDFVQFMLSLVIQTFIYLSGSLESRLEGYLTINNAIFYYFVLGLPLYKHHFFSLIVIGVCIVIIIFIEYIFQDINIFLTYGRLTAAIIITLVCKFLDALEKSIQKYLFEYNQLSPFLVLLFEGIFGFLLSVIFSIFKNPFDEIILFKKNNSDKDFIVLIIALIIYMILSGFKNIFVVLTTKIFTPMTTTFMDYILNPFFIIYYFCDGNDFKSNGKSDAFYFILNLILSLIITFCGGVYNEFMILFCCGLERDTHNQVKKRAFFESAYNLFYAVEEETNETDS